MALVSTLVKFPFSSSLSLPHSNGLLESSIPGSCLPRLPSPPAALTIRPLPRLAPPPLLLSAPSPKSPISPCRQFLPSRCSISLLGWSETGSPQDTVHLFPRKTAVPQEPSPLAKGLPQLMERSRGGGTGRAVRSRRSSRTRGLGLTPLPQLLLAPPTSLRLWEPPSRSRQRRVC